MKIGEEVRVRTVDGTETIDVTFCRDSREICINSPICSVEITEVYLPGPDISFWQEITSQEELLYFLKVAVVRKFNRKCQELRDPYSSPIKECHQEGCCGNSNNCSGGCSGCH